jgi:hypothetical protein
MALRKSKEARVKRQENTVKNIEFKFRRNDLYCSVGFQPDGGGTIHIVASGFNPMEIAKMDLDR